MQAVVAIDLRYHSSSSTRFVYHSSRTVHHHTSDRTTFVSQLLPTILRIFYSGQLFSYFHDYVICIGFITNNIFPTFFIQEKGMLSPLGMLVLCVSDKAKMTNIWESDENFARQSFAQQDVHTLSKP